MHSFNLFYHMDSNLSWEYEYYVTGQHAVMHCHTHSNDITEVKLFVSELLFLLVNNGQSYEQSIITGKMAGPYYLWKLRGSITNH